MMSSDDNLLPELKQVNNYISVIEFLCGSLYNDCNLSLLLFLILSLMTL